MLDKLMDWVERKAGPDEPGRIRRWLADAAAAAAIAAVLVALLILTP